MSDIPMLTGPNGGELVFDTASGAVVELLTTGGFFPTHPATDPAPFVPAESRIAQLEASIKLASAALWRIRDAAGGNDLMMTPDSVVRLVVERLATLEADLAASREREARSERQAEIATLGWERATEREASWALIVRKIKARLSTTKESPQWTWVDFNYMVEAVRGLLSDCDHATILAAHDAEVARKAKVEAMEKLLQGSTWLVNGKDLVYAEWIKAEIAALKAEGGKG